MLVNTLRIRERERIARGSVQRLHQEQKLTIPGQKVAKTLEYYPFITLI